MEWLLENFTTICERTLVALGLVEAGHQDTTYSRLRLIVSRTNS